MITYSISTPDGLHTMALGGIQLDRYVRELLSMGYLPNNITITVESDE